MPHGEPIASVTRRNSRHNRHRWLGGGSLLRGGGHPPRFSLGDRRPGDEPVESPFAVDRWRMARAAALGGSGDVGLAGVAGVGGQGAQLA
jgi:hypothetical protein